jgi:hypothetical protein
MREEIKFNKVVDFTDRTITFLNYTFYDKLNGENHCGAVGSIILLLTKEECDEYEHIEEPSLIIQESIKDFLKDKNIQYHKMLFDGGGRVFKEDFDGNVSKELNNEIFVAECSNTFPI